MTHQSHGSLPHTWEHFGSRFFDNVQHRHRTSLVSKQEEDVTREELLEPREHNYWVSGPSYKISLSPIGWNLASYDQTKTNSQEEHSVDMTPVRAFGKRVQHPFRWITVVLGK